MRIWFDFHNPPDVNVLSPILTELKNHEPIVTTRRFAQLEGLLDRRGISYRVIGGHQGGSMLSKAAETGLRAARLATTLPRFDVSIASLGLPCVVAARLRGRPAIAFLDGDIVTSNLRTSAPFVSRMFIPKAYDDRVLERLGLRSKAVRYPGYKEQIAASTYEPDPGFMSRLPFSEYVLIRGEALEAEYVPRESTTIVPELLHRFEEAGVKILLLPRYPTDRTYAAGHANVHVPSEPVNGLDACFHARAVLTGSGTLAREASVLGVPAASFFPGPNLLSVDRDMIARRWYIHSRDPAVLVRHALTAERRPFDQDECRRVLAEVMRSLGRYLTEIAASERSWSLPSRLPPAPR